MLRYSESLQVCLCVIQLKMNSVRVYFYSTFHISAPFSIMFQSSFTENATFQPAHLLLIKRAY